MNWLCRTADASFSRPSILFSSFSMRAASIITSAPLEFVSTSLSPARVELHKYGEQKSAATTEIDIQFRTTERFLSLQKCLSSLIDKGNNSNQMNLPKFTFFSLPGWGGLGEGNLQKWNIRLLSPLPGPPDQAEEVYHSMSESDFEHLPLAITMAKPQ